MLPFGILASRNKLSITLENLALFAGQIQIKAAIFLNALILKLLSVRGGLKLCSAISAFHAGRTGLSARLFGLCLLKQGGGLLILHLSLTGRHLQQLGWGWPGLGRDNFGYVLNIARLEHALADFLLVERWPNSGMPGQLKQNLSLSEALHVCNHVRVCTWVNIAILIAVIIAHNWRHLLGLHLPHFRRHCLRIRCHAGLWPDSARRDSARSRSLSRHGWRTALDLRHSPLRLPI